MASNEGARSEFPRVTSINEEARQYPSVVEAPDEWVGQAPDTQFVAWGPPEILSHSGVTSELERLRHHLKPSLLSRIGDRLLGPSPARQKAKRIYARENETRRTILE